MGDMEARLNINLPTDLKKRLDKLSSETDRPVAAMVRRAVEAYLEQEEAIQRKRK